MVTEGETAMTADGNRVVVEFKLVHQERSERLENCRMRVIWKRERDLSHRLRRKTHTKSESRDYRCMRCHQESSQLERCTRPTLGSNGSSS